MSDLTDRFENGETRYFQDLNFKQAIDCLSTGVGVYAVLDGTLKKLARAEMANEKISEACRLALHEKAELIEALAELEKQNKVFREGLIRCGAKTAELETNLKQYESI